MFWCLSVSVSQSSLCVCFTEIARVRLSWTLIAASFMQKWARLEKEGYLPLLPTAPSWDQLYKTFLTWFSQVLTCCIMDWSVYLIVFLCSNFSQWQTVIVRWILRLWYKCIKCPVMELILEGDEGCISPSGKLLCLWQTPNNYAAHTWHHAIHVWLLCQSGCLSPSTKELHGPMFSACTSITTMSKVFYITMLLEGGLLLSPTPPCRQLNALRRITNITLRKASRVDTTLTINKHFFREMTTQDDAIKQIGAMVTEY